MPCHLEPLGGVTRSEMENHLMEPIRWADIEAECGGYRAGFVAVFRKYEGRPTDKKDGQGRTVKVTQRSFAEHFGISSSSFARWVRQTSHAGTPGDYREGKPGKTRTGQIARQAVKSDKVAIEDKVGMLDDLLSDKTVTREWREARAKRHGIDTSKAGRKARDARGAAATADLRKAMGALSAFGLVCTIEAAADMLEELTAEGIAAGDMRKIRAAFDRLGGCIVVAEADQLTRGVRS